MIQRASLAFILSAGIMQAAQAVPSVHLSDVIPDALRTQFNGFESIPNDGIHYTGGAGPYTEDGITVQQINGDSGNDIWVTNTNLVSQQQGSYSWYPEGGDSGYTEIKLSSGLNFQDIGMRIGSGTSAQTVLYELLEGGVTVLSGSYTAPGIFYYSRYLGFSGGGFDTIRVSDSFIAAFGGTVTDGHFNALTVDSIEIGPAVVSAPGTLPLLAAGFVGFAWRRGKA